MASVVAPAFPIPNFVLFPGCTVTLHIAKSDLVAPLEAALAGDRMVCLARARDSQPARVGCLAQVRQVRRVRNGYQVTLAGLRRVKLECEIHQGSTRYWTGLVLPSQEWTSERRPELPSAGPEVQACRDHFPTPTWLDIASFHSSGLSVDDKQALLEQPDPHLRYHRLLESVPPKTAPPKVSLN